MSLERFLHRGDVPEDVKEAIIHDFEKRKRVRKALVALKGNVQGLIDQNLVGVYVFQDGKLVFANQKLADTLGYTRDELLAMSSVFDLVVDEDRMMVAENIARRLSGDVQSVQYTLRVRHKNGSIVTAEVHGTRTLYDGKPAIVGVAIDRQKPISC